MDAQKQVKIVFVQYRTDNDGVMIQVQPQIAMEDNTVANFGEAENVFTTNTALGVLAKFDGRQPDFWGDADVISTVANACHPDVVVPPEKEGDPFTTAGGGLRFPKWKVV